MRRTILSFLAVVLAAFAAGAAGPALAHKADVLMHRPYVIEKTCNAHFRHCRPRMVYAPGQHAGLAGQPSYWYQAPPGKGKHGDFRLRSHQHIAHKHKAHKHKAHAHKTYGKHKHRKADRHHCRLQGWGFDTATLSFAEGIPKRARCIRSYDWQ